MQPLRFTPRKLALTASLAAVYTVFRLIPVSKFLGLQGFLTANGMVTPILGFLLDPSYGLLAVFIGTIVASFAPWNPLRFGGLDFLPGTLNLLVVSLAIRGRRIEAGFIFIAVIVAFTLTPFTRVFVGTNLLSPPVPYFWLHLVALVLLLSPLSADLGNQLRSGSYADVGTAIAIIAFAGTMIEHLTGGILFAFFFGPGALKFWPGIYLIYPIERAVIVAGAVLLSSPVVRMVRTQVQGTILEKTRLTLPWRKRTD